MSLISEFAEVASNRPQQTALITEKSQLSYQDILDLVQVFDIELSSNGVRSGQTLILDSSRAEFCLVMALLLSYKGLSVAYTSAHQATQAGIDFDFVVTENMSDEISTEKQIVIDGSWFAALGTYPKIDFRMHSGPVGHFIMQSSGSTGIPKFIIAKEEERLKTAQNGHEVLGVSLKGRRACSSLSPRAGWSMTVNLCALLSGGSVVALSENREDLALYIDLYRIDVLVTTPAILANLIKHEQTSQFLTSLRDVRIGGAMVGQRLTKEFSNICDANLHMGYGAAETGTLLTYTHNSDTHFPEGYLGKPVRDEIEVAFFKPDLTPLPNATEGVVGFRFSKPGALRTYLGNDPTSNSGLVDGCFFPGDMMKLDDLGYHYIGRVKNIINFSGNKFSLETITLFLEDKLAGSQIAALVELDEHGLERLALFVVSDTEITMQASEAALKARFSGLKISRVEPLSKFPMVPNGKIDIAKLKQDYGLN